MTLASLVLMLVAVGTDSTVMAIMGAAYLISGTIEAGNIITERKRNER